MPDNSDLDNIFAEALAAEQGGFADDLGGEDVEMADEPYVESADEVEIGDHEFDGEPEDGSVTDGSDSWNWEEFSDQLVPVTVDGATEMVTLRELRDRGMRQADYTRKTQEIAEIRKTAEWANAVQSAFERDPQATLMALAQAYGVYDPGQGVASQDDRRALSLDDLDEDVRPWAAQAQQAAQQAQQLQQKVAAMEMEQLKAEINAELHQMKARYGDSFDPVAVLSTAADKGVSLSDAYWLVQGQRSFYEQQQRSQADSAAGRAAEQAKAEADKQRASRKEKAASATQRSFKASDIVPDDFNDIGELMEQLMAADGS